MSFAAIRTSRDSTGLIITVAVHAGIGALALVGLGIVELPKAPPVPITAINIPDPPPP